MLYTYGNPKIAGFEKIWKRQPLNNPMVYVNDYQVLLLFAKHTRNSNDNEFIAYSDYIGGQKRFRQEPPRLPYLACARCSNDIIATMP